MASNKTVVDAKGNVHTLCNYSYTSTDRITSKSVTETCHSARACKICGQCSKIDGAREKGHCTGHHGLMQHIPVPGNEAYKLINKNG